MATTINTSNTKNLILCGMFAAITTVCSWITIPLGFTPVPVNLATLAVFMTGGLLGPKYGPLSLTVYTLAGAVGIPVFAGFRGGLAVIAGPTGGYIIGYILAAFIAGLLISDSSSSHSALRIVPALVLALAACYALGTVWFIYSTGTNIGAALLSCVIPFLPGDALKIAAATVLIGKLRHHLQNL